MYPEVGLRLHRVTSVSPITLEAVQRTDLLFALKREVNGLSADERRRGRQERSRPVMVDLHTWLGEQRQALRFVGGLPTIRLHAQALDAV